jgi:nitronate monooxygenase
VTSLQRAGSEVWITVTTLEEAIAAVSVGADALIVQGAEAGGHRASFYDLQTNDLADGLTLSVLLQLVLDVFDVPCVASGGLMTGRAIAGVLSAGAVAAQLGTAFLRTPEAGTAPVHLAALASQEPTAMTRAFTGRLARGIRNRFIVEHTSAAPSGYPEIHFATAPIRAAGRESGNGDVVNLWAGQAYLLARELPAGELVRILAGEIAIALSSVTRRIRV